VAGSRRRTSDNVARPSKPPRRRIAPPAVTAASRLSGCGRLNAAVRASIPVTCRAMADDGPVPGEVAPGEWSADARGGEDGEAGSVPAADGGPTLGDGGRAETPPHADRPSSARRANPDDAGRMARQRRRDGFRGGDRTWRDDTRFLRKDVPGA